MAFDSHAELSMLWNADTYSNVDVTITGMGSTDLSQAGNLLATGTVISPSGVWELIFWMSGNYEQEGAYFHFGSRADLIFLGNVRCLTDPNFTIINPAIGSEGYGDFFLMPVKPFRDGGALMFGALASPQEWRGFHTFDIGSIPDPYDTSTWGWTGQFSISGPTLIPVPEPGTAALVSIDLAFGVMARIWHRSHLCVNTQD